jgi:hypothetical protein
MEECTMTTVTIDENTVKAIRAEMKERRAKIKVWRRNIEDEQKIIGALEEKCALVEGMLQAA